MEASTSKSQIDFKKSLKRSNELSIIPLPRRKQELDVDPLALPPQESNLYVIRPSQQPPKDAFQLKATLYAENHFDYDELDDLICYSPEPEEDSMDSKDVFKSRDTFIQNENCFSTSQCLPQCHECEKDPMTNKYTCRFYEFRKIERNNGKCEVAGFLDSYIDPSIADLDLWTLRDGLLNIDSESADYILRCIATQFCELAELELKIGKDQKNISWKRSVPQVREICDVCDTSVFNFHWTCTHCGTCVCSDCHGERQAGNSRWKPKTKTDKEDRDNFFWLKCHAQGHDKVEHTMMLVKMTTGDALMFLNENLHKICEQRNITQDCGCSLRNKNCTRVQSKKKMLDQPKAETLTGNALRQIIKRQRYKDKITAMPRIGLMEENLLNKSVKQSTVSKQIVKILEPSESAECYKIFQNQWEQGKPVVVANVTRNMRKYSWSPEYFSTKFGNEKHVMIDCQNDVAINRVAMKYFWDGFTSVKKRLPRDCDQKCVLKLKDWPTSDDFADVMKEHFDDIMKAVPLAAYTNRDGKFNLARYLPKHFSRPDLGPKMYSAYSQIHPAKQGSTNLHLDVSDAINVMVHVSKPTDAHLAPNQYGKNAILDALKVAGADQEDIQNLISGRKLPGAIWHIFPAHQSYDIRRVLHEVAREKGKSVGVNDDPIHDQNWYIDESLRKRLKENDVVGYTIVQYEGDAVFIPAGAPHQVLNVHDCIKVALDFVAPENLSECLDLTEEFRILSERHQNHEDRLQVKNILYHTIKNLIPAQPDI